jgi:hypothetical protein
MLFKEMIAIYCENNTRSINAKLSVIDYWSKLDKQLPLGFKMLNCAHLYVLYIMTFPHRIVSLNNFWSMKCIHCMYVCIICTYVYVYMYCIYICVCMCVSYVYICMYVCVYVCLYACVYVCTYVESRFGHSGWRGNYTVLGKQKMHNFNFW